MLYNCDVLIVGAGPAGSSAALTLLNHSDADIIVLEQSDFQHIRIGENVSPAIFDLIDYLQVSKQEFTEDCFTSTFSGTSYWGSDKPANREAMFSALEGSYQIDREAFDLTLIAKIIDKGGKVFPRSRCVGISKQEPGWLVNVQHPEQGRFSIKARYLFDAGGRNSTLGKQLDNTPTKLDDLMGAGTFMRFTDPKTLPKEQLIESTKLGWWYCAALSQEHMVVTFFSDADLLHKHRLNRPENWLNLLNQTSHLSKRLKGAVSNLPSPWVRNAASQISESSFETGYYAIGDAACAFDPISSMGIGFAMTSGCQAAVAAIAEMCHHDQLAGRQYQQKINEQFQQYLSSRQQFYQLERRWCQSEFWQRRQQPI